VRAIHVDQAQNLWIGTKGGGLNKFDPVSRTFTGYQHDPNNPNSLSSNVHQDRAGQLWLGTAGGGLVKFEPQTQAFTRYPADPANPTRLSSPDINFIYEDLSGMLWVGTKGGGLNQFDPETEQFTRYQYNADDSASLGNDDVYAIVAAPADTLWIATYGGGLNRLALPSGQRFDVVDDGHMRHSGQFRRYQHDPTDPNSLSNNDVYALYPDPTGLLWIGTANGGLSRFDPEMETFVHWTQQDGLSSDVVFGVLPDEAGNLWLSTSKGLSKFNPQTGTFTNYDTSDGLERIGYNEGAYYKSQDGRMFFGGIPQSPPQKDDPLFRPGSITGG
jgi:ligand-binding sensor domain-containing protein